MHLFTKVKSDLVTILSSYIDQEQLLNSVSVELPREQGHGDMATNAAMVLAKAVGKNPREFAQLLLPAIKGLEYVIDAEIAGPGFINLKIKNSFWHQIIKEILQQGINYGDSDLINNEPINLEFVSTNPTGPMHIGHARGAVFGDVLANLLRKCGANVTTEYYVNDYGNQVNILASSSYLRYLEAMGEEVTIPEGFYPGEYLIPVGQALSQIYGKSLTEMDETTRLEIIKKFAVNSMMDLIRKDLSLIGVQHDLFVSEDQLHHDGKSEIAFKALEKAGYIYKAVLEKPKGKLTENWQERENTLFRSTVFGDDQDRPVKNADGNWSYLGAELASVQNKLDRGFRQMILVLGADHVGYTSRVKALVKALSDNQVDIEVKICQLISWVENGNILKMSKRSGNFITAEDIVEMVGKDALRFMMLTRKNEMTFDFDVNKVKEQSKDNPVFYVQYAHARAQSILRNAENDLPAASSLLSHPENIKIALLDSVDELELIKLLAFWPKLVESAALSREVHKIVFYLQDVAAAFHGFWNKGKENQNLRFILLDNIELTAARLVLTKAVANVIASGLNVIGVTAADSM